MQYAPSVIVVVKFTSHPHYISLLMPRVLALV